MDDLKFKDEEHVDLQKVEHSEYPYMHALHDWMHQNRSNNGKI